MPNSVVNIINNDNFYFMQIGSNDGVTSDPIYTFIKKYDWHGIMFEPQKESFKKLFDIYQNNKKIKLINMGIAETNAQYKLYKHLPNESVKQDHSGGSSLLLRKSAEFYEDEYEFIDCTTFNDVIRDYHINKIDLLVIDTEGYDMTIINSINFNLIKPKNIWFEYWPYDNDDKNNLIEFTSYNQSKHIIDKLNMNGYILTKFDNNVLASLDWSPDVKD
jgi:FkbM family methyltransferase